MAPSPDSTGRRGSLAESVEVKVVITETSTYIPASYPIVTAAPWDHTTSPSPRTAMLASFPVTHSAPFSCYQEHNTPEPSSPPPSYAPSLSHPPHTTPLSFFPTATSSAEPTLPTYRQVPRTRAEKCFWWGFLCPLIFLYGALHLWRPERLVGPEDLEAAERTEELEVEIRMALEEGMYGPGMQARPPSVKESLELWRSEEVLWAKRCFSCFGGALVLAIVFSVVVASVAKEL